LDASTTRLGDERQHMTASGKASPSLLRRSLVAACVLALAATACGGSDKGSPTPAAAAGGDKTVTISNFEFSPDTLMVKVGDTVTVQNKDSAEHTVTATDGSFDTGRFASGTKTFTVTKAGRFEFACNVHPFMTHKFIQVAG
jgi:plastocyanin